MPWNYPPRAFTAPNSGAGGVTFTNTAAPAVAGSTLILPVGVRPTVATTIPTVTVTDNLGGTWERLVQGPTGGSTFTEIWMRRNAAGVTTITVGTAAGGSDIQNIHAHPLEWTGATPGTIVVKPAANASATSWPAATVAAPAGAVVVGNLSLGVTNREILMTEADYTASGDLKSSGLNSLSAHRLAPTAMTTGPTWAVGPGGSSTGASSSVAATVAIAPATEPDPDPDPEPVTTMLRRVNADGTLTPVRLAWAYADRVDYGDTA